MTGFRPPASPTTGFLPSQNVTSITSDTLGVLKLLPTLSYIRVLRMGWDSNPLYFSIFIQRLTASSYRLFSYRIRIYSLHRNGIYFFESYIIFIIMKPLYTQEEFDNSKTQDRLPLECYHCGNSFDYRKKDIIEVSNPKLNKQGKYCSRSCKCLHEGLSKKVNCSNCDKEFIKTNNQIKKTNNNFCSQSCSATYNNEHKKHGTRRSKLEVWLEEQLSILYPELHVDYNKSDAIGSELDIHIPSLNLAIELNGIFHYEPIFGKDKLQKIQENDQSKSKACIDNQIDLCTIDVSSLKYFKPKNAQQYLDIINNVIKKRC